MIIEEQIRAFIANKLSPGEEQEFLISLAADEKRSVALKTEMTLLRGVATDAQGVDVSRAVETSLFTSLGFHQTISGAGGKPHASFSASANIITTGLRTLLFVGAGFVGGYAVNEFTHNGVAPQVQTGYEQQQEVTKPVVPNIHDIEKPLKKVAPPVIKEQTALTAEKPVTSPALVPAREAVTSTKDSSHLPPIEVNVKVRKPAQPSLPSPK